MAGRDCPRGPPAVSPSTAAPGPTGTAKPIRLPDGSRTLRLESLDTSNGPDLRAWLTDAPVKEGAAGWTAQGQQGRPELRDPARRQLADFNSVTIWYDRFDRSFGAAALTSV
ncbi:DM13 domain-containing protein [Streptomyces sp. NPDC001586]|uniref:DM13 domain-containing protein n=1 Tax=Streptomyces sp. NPDC001586 TaxID=3154387 RepID=UPI00332F8B11